MCSTFLDKAIVIKFLSHPELLRFPLASFLLFSKVSSEKKCVNLFKKTIV